VDLFRPLSRRQVLLGATGTVLLAACAKKEDGGDDASLPSTTSTLPGASSGGLVLFTAFQPKQPAGVDIRLPLALADSEGSFDVVLA
jgi:hypothetical protein